MSSSPVPIVPVDQLGTQTTLLGLFAQLTDPRDPRGERHALPVILTVTMAAVLADAKSFTAIGQWARTLAPRQRPGWMSTPDPKPPRSDACCRRWIRKAAPHNTSSANSAETRRSSSHPTGGT